MTISWSIRTVALVALAAAVAATAADPAQSRPDPNSGAGTWPAARDVASNPRPTGPAEHASIRGLPAASEDSVRATSAAATPVVEVPAAPAGFDWRSAGIGALGTAGAVALAVGAVIARRRPGSARSVRA